MSGQPPGTGGQTQATQNSQQAQAPAVQRQKVQLKTIHDVRLRYFKEPYPTSTLVEVKGFVNPDALIEINAVAAVSGQRARKT